MRSVWPLAATMLTAAWAGCIADGSPELGLEVGDAEASLAATVTLGDGFKRFDVDLSDQEFENDAVVYAVTAHEDLLVEVAFVVESPGYADADACLVGSLDVAGLESAETADRRAQSRASTSAAAAAVPISPVVGARVLWTYDLDRFVSVTAGGLHADPADGALTNVLDDVRGTVLGGMWTMTAGSQLVFAMGGRSHELARIQAHEAHANVTAYGSATLAQVGRIALQCGTGLTGPSDAVAAVNVWPTGTVVGYDVQMESQQGSTLIFGAPSNYVGPRVGRLVVPGEDPVEIPHASFRHVRSVPESGMLGFSVDAWAGDAYPEPFWFVADAVWPEVIGYGPFE